jgi:hypothetical protein
MATFLWPGDPGWPAPEADDEPDVEDPAADLDIDAICLHAAGPHVFDDLTDLERTVVACHYGLRPPERSIEQLHDELHLPSSLLRHELDTALWKLRAHLTG